jgi:hypothetical protein
MTYDSDEISVASGRPIELYTLIADTGQTWRYCSLPEGETVTYLGYEYIAENIQRENVNLTKNSFVNELEIIFGRNNEFALQFVSAPIEGRVSLTVSRGHGSNYVTFWTGEMIGIIFDTDAKATATFSPRICSMVRVGKRRLVSRLCGHVLFGSECKLTDTTYRVTGTLSNVNGLVLTSSAFSSYSDDYFKAGKIKIGTSYRLITDHTTNTVTVDRIMSSAVIGASFDAYPGCDRAPTTCLNKFSNKANFGGLEFIPNLNPFVGSINTMTENPKSGVV